MFTCIITYAFFELNVSVIEYVVKIPPLPVTVKGGGGFSREPPKLVVFALFYSYHSTILSYKRFVIALKKFILPYDVHSKSS